jgi:hypothetical protein
MLHAYPPQRNKKGEFGHAVEGLAQGSPSTTGPYGDFCTSRFFGGRGFPRFSSSTFANLALALRCCGVWACNEICKFRWTALFWEPGGCALPL